MTLDTFLDPKVLHHAYCIEGERADILPPLFEFFESDLGFVTKGNPDFWHGEFETLGIDDGRMLKELGSRKSAGGGRKLFVVCFHFITTEAQNSLLKLFEEPTSGTHFFLIVPHAHIFLPTLRSRLVIVRDEHYGLTKSIDTAEKFLQAMFSQRVEMLKKLIEEKDKQKAITFLNELEAVLYMRQDALERGQEDVRVLEEIEACRSYLYDRAPSVKMLLEHVALVVPTQR